VFVAKRIGIGEAALVAIMASAALAASPASAQRWYPYAAPAPAYPYGPQSYAYPPYAGPSAYPAYVQPQPCCLAQAGTEVAVELVQAVGTRTAKAGDTFPIRLAAPLIIGGQMAIPAGTPGIGRVVQASGAGLGGKGAKLVVSADYLTVKGGIVPLQGMQLTGTGKDHTFAADIASLGSWYSAPLGLVGFAVTGGEIEIPAGTAASAKIAQTLNFVALGAATPQDYQQVQAVFGEPQTSRGWKAVPPPPPGMGQVVFFRAKTAAGFGLWFKVREHGEELGKLSNGAYFIVPLQPGEHRFSATLEPEFKDHLTLKVDPGETYYVEGIMTHGAVLGVADLTPSDKAHFDAVSRQLQAAAPPATARVG
jgi:hypothetical protein